MSLLELANTDGQLGAIAPFPINIGAGDNSIEFTDFDVFHRAEFELRNYGGDERLHLRYAESIPQTG